MLIHDRNLCLYLSFLQDNIGPLLNHFYLKVTTEEVDKPPNTYQLNETCRGLVVIFNYMKFDNKSLKHRSGALTDSENLKSVFEQMNYVVEIKPDLTRDVTLANLVDIRQRVDHDSLILFFLSHGKGENTFYTKDAGRSLSVNRIMYHFTNTLCPSLKGKPKILLFNFCRGNSNEQSNLESDGDQDSDEDSEQEDIEIDGNPRIPQEAPKDMDLVHASLPGIMAARSKSTGTIFVNSLCNILCESAQTKDLHDIVTETSKLSQKKGGTTASHTPIDMVKKFYFM